MYGKVIVTDWLGML